MQRAGDLESFVGNPIGHYLVGPTWIHFSAHEALFGIVMFGRPQREDTERLTHSLLCELGPRVGRHRSLVDTRRLDAVDPGAFATLQSYVRDHGAALRQKVERLALVRPKGIEGAIVTGFYGLLDAPYPVALFDDPREAFLSLGEPPSLAADLDAIVAEATQQQPIVGALRAFLATHAPDVSFDSACRALGTSERTLQRRLAEAGTTMQKEWLAARVREAQRRLLTSDDALTAVALETGFSSLQQFSTQFRKATGVSPSAWREQHRRR